MPVGSPVWEPGRSVLAPMGVGETLDAAIKLYRRHWKPFMGIAAFILVPYSFIQQAVIAAFSHPLSVQTGPFGTTQRVTTDAGLVLSAVFTLVAFAFITPFLAGALARATAETYADRVPDIRSTYRFALSRLWAILLVSVLTALAVAGGFVLLIVPGFLFYVRFLFGPPIVVIEDVRGTKAMRRSWRLAKGHFWRLFGTTLLAGLLSGIVAGLISAVFVFLGFVGGSFGWVFSAIGASIGGVIARPFVSIVTVLLYFDLRVRKEGLDLAVALQQMQTHTP